MRYLSQPFRLILFAVSFLALPLALAAQSSPQKVFVRSTRGDLETRAAKLLADRPNITVVSDISSSDLILDVTMKYDFQTDVRRNEKGKPDTMNQRTVSVVKTSLAVYPTDSKGKADPLWKKSRSQTTSDVPYHDSKRLVSDPDKLDITPAMNSKPKDHLSPLIDDFVKYLSKKASSE